jgi:phosphoenolpyruvate carboxykinase (GTP)
LTAATSIPGLFPAPTKHAKLIAWVEQTAALTQPDRVHWCDGSDAEWNTLTAELVAGGTLKPLNPAKRPNSFFAASDPRDVARVESRTFICSEKEEDAGPTNNWLDPTEMRADLQDLFKGCMKGRTMYVCPFSMGPLGSKISQLGVEITDSAYVAISMRVMTRMGAGALKELGDDAFFVPALHSVGMPLAEGQADVPWPCNEIKYIVHFPESREIWSYGSGYGGNALLGKKCFALRIASVMARDEGWLAEHMLILKLTSPQGRRPATSPRPSPAPAARPTWPCCSRPCRAGRPRPSATTSAGCASVTTAACTRSIPRPASSASPRAPASTPTERDRLARIPTAIFTNVALTADGDVWWEGLTDEKPAHLTDWKGRPWTPESGEPAPTPTPASPPRRAVPGHRPGMGGPQGRADLAPSCSAAAAPAPCRWSPRPSTGRTACSWAPTWPRRAPPPRRTSRRRAAPRPLRHAAVLRLQHGRLFRPLAEDRRQGRRREAAAHLLHGQLVPQGRERPFVWPGFGDNSRVLKWIFERLEGEADLRAVDTPIGTRPHNADHATILTEDELVEVAGCLDEGDYALIASATHELDGRVAQAILTAGRFRYCGMIGSRKKRDEILASRSRRRGCRRPRSPACNAPSASPNSTAALPK